LLIRLFWLLQNDLSQLPLRRSDMWSFEKCSCFRTISFWNITEQLEVLHMAKDDFLTYCVWLLKRIASYSGMSLVWHHSISEHSIHLICPWIADHCTLPLAFCINVKLLMMGNFPFYVMDSYLLYRKKIFFLLEGSHTTSTITLWFSWISKRLAL